MLLTIGMMVKNEEKHLEECLDSLVPLLDNLDAELVIVDTGSEDKTVEIARKYTEKLYFHEWNNNFSEMRNITIGYAKGDWFFCIDGDEVLEEPEKIIEFFKTGDYLEYYSASMGVKNLTNSKDLSKYGLCDGIRLFKNDGYFKYQGNVHNQPIFKEPTKKILCTLKHYGYISDDKELMEKKFIRTASILKSELKKNPNSVYYRYQLAVSYLMHMDYKDALREIISAAKLVKKPDEYNYKYIYNEYANILVSNHKFKECEKLCEDKLLLSKSDEAFKIDLLFYLAKAQCFQGDFDNSIKNYKRYIKLLDKLECGQLPLDLTIKILSSSDRKIAYHDIIVMEYSKNNYLEVLRYAENLDEEKIIKKVLSNIIDSYVKLKMIRELRDLYEEYYLKYSIELIREFQSELEKIKLNLKNDVLRQEIEREFTNVNDSTQYKNLNLIRLCTNKNEFKEIYSNILNSVDLNNESLCYGELLYIAIKNKYDVNCLIKELRYDVIYLYLEYLKKRYKDIGDLIFGFIKSNSSHEDDIAINKTFMVLSKALLIWDEINGKDYGVVLNLYVHNGIRLIKKVYSSYILDNEIILEVKNSEHEFLVYMYKAEKVKNDKAKYLRYLKMALRAYPQMKEAINYILDNIKEEEQIESVKIQELKKQLIDNINVLLSNGQLVDVKNIIENYKKMFSHDVDICSVESVMLIMEEKYEEAEDILLKALSIDEDNVDLLYNLGYIYKIQGKNELSYRYYKKIMDNCIDAQLLGEVSEILQGIKEENPDIDKSVGKKKIVFFVRKGLDSFIDDIIKHIQVNFETKKVIVTEYNQIEEEMKWADICWFEWCDELIAYGSNHKLALNKKIVCRLHRYEVFTDYPKNVNWNNVDKLIVVTEHLKGLLKQQMPSIDKQVDIVTINNGVDINKYKFKERKPGFNIAYIGYIHSRKNPVMLLQIINKLVKKDKRYKLYVAGEFQDYLVEMYWKYQIDKMNLQNNVIFEGWQKNIDKWVANKNYIISTSIHESFGYGIAEAMSRGIKPIIHDFICSEEIWDKKYLFNTVEDACNMIITEDYNSTEYRKFIEKNYSLDKQIEKINDEITSLIDEKNEDNIYLINYENKDIKFYLPYHNDHVERSIIMSNNFYEIQMLEDIKKRIGLNKVIVDVGANIGNHTVFFANICEANKVYSFEPQKNIYDILLKNVQINMFNKNVNLFNMGVGREISKGSVKIIDNKNFGMSKLEKSKEGNIYIDTLDNMLFEKEKKIDMIKIDVEGMEMDVLMGAEKILKEYKPILYIEAATDDYFNEISNYLKKFNYKAKIRFNHTPTYLFE